MEHTQATVGKRPINNMEMISCQVLSEQLIDILEPSLATNLKIAASNQLIEILFGIPMPKGGRSKNYPIHGVIVAIAIRASKQGSETGSSELVFVFKYYGTAARWLAPAT